MKKGGKANGDSPNVSRVSNTNKLKATNHPKQIVHQFEAEKQIVQSKGDLQINSPYLIKKNRETFEPFIEDDVPFDEYCQSMEKDGTWAGHMELQAASLVTHRNICIHRHMSPRWYIKNFDDRATRMVHLRMLISLRHLIKQKLHAEKVEQICVGKHQFLVL
ncbi:hypothetical protein V6N11_063638 [Hibiscus sabdariffa]|uniref:OTU domain-containing protein n=1 Tax=Hibiscus sabdariffa TaxID=183260 RepID=A0ABR2PLB5_9ROSI